jgi:hypothetical protein
MNESNPSNRFNVGAMAQIRDPSKISEPNNRPLFLLPILSMRTPPQTTKTIFGSAYREKKKPYSDLLSDKS